MSDYAQDLLGSGHFCLHAEIVQSVDQLQFRLQRLAFIVLNGEFVVEIVFFPACGELELMGKVLVFYAKSGLHVPFLLFVGCVSLSSVYPKGAVLSVTMSQKRAASISRPT